VETNDVVIVGGGIGGAVLALALGRCGWKVKLLEREKQPPQIERPEVLWGTTPDALNCLGVGEAIRTEASVRLERIEIHAGEQRLLSLSREEFDAAKVAAYSTAPSRTRELIATAAAATGNVTFEGGVKVQQVLLEGDRIVGVQAQRDEGSVVERARLIVGDDGAHSLVRGAIERVVRSESLKLKIFPLDFLTTVIPWPTVLPPNQVRVWLNSRTFRTGVPALGCLPWPGSRGVCLMPLPHARAESLLRTSSAQFFAELKKLTPVAATLADYLKFPADFRHVRRPFGHAGNYVASGAAIVGDAVHPVSPAGGQGANAAIWDALALAKVAHEALTADDLSRERLSQYEMLRRPHNRDSVAITERAARLYGWVSPIPGLPWLIPTALRYIDRRSRLKSRLIGSIATMFVTRDAECVR
jgi:2-polyprenyl-6-methoxyphenol hydroxylase-like FAD-dependent oxidoreductase